LAQRNHWDLGRNVPNEQKPASRNGRLRDQNTFKYRRTAGDLIVESSALALPYYIRSTATFTLCGKNSQWQVSAQAVGDATRQTQLTGYRPPCTPRAGAGL